MLRAVGWTFVLLFAAGCTRQQVELSGRACAEGGCAEGFVCNQSTGMCCAFDDELCASADNGPDD